MRTGLRGSWFWLMAIIFSIVGAFSPARAASSSATQAPAQPKQPAKAAPEEAPPALVEAAKKEGVLIWLGTDSPEFANPVIAAFTKKYPFMKVDYTKGIGTDHGDRILMEADAGKCTVDFYNGASSYIGQFTERKLMKNVSDLPFWKLWPKPALDPNGYWFGMDTTNWVLGYNSSLLSAADVPKSYDEIAAPKWKGQFAIEERPDHWFLGLWLEYGPEKATAILQKVMANTPFIGKGYTANAELLAAGQYKFTFPLQDYKITQMQGKKTPISWAPLRPMTVECQAALVLRNAPHPNTAELFLRWLTTEEGQKTFNKATQKASLHPALEAYRPLGLTPKDVKTVFITGFLHLLAPGQPVRKTWDRLVFGM